MTLLCKVVLFLAICICIAESTDPLGNFCNKGSEVSSSSKISANINSLLPELVLRASKTGFVTSFYGTGRDKVYGLAQCRGDVSTAECANCVKDAAKQIRKLCPKESDARIWYDYCFLRYDKKSSFIGKVDTYGIYYVNVETVSDPDSFNKKLGALMDRVRKDATKPSNNGLGKGETEISPFLTLYALGQCTRDLAPIDCAQCLAIAVGNFPNFCKDRKGCRVLYSSCYVRYELYPFFFPLSSNNTAAKDRTQITVVRP